MPGEFGPCWLICSCCVCFIWSVVVDWLLDIGLQLPAPLLIFGLPAFGGGRGGKLLAVCCDCAGLRPIKFGAEMNDHNRKININWNEGNIKKNKTMQTSSWITKKLNKSMVSEIVFFLQKLPMVFGEPYGNCCLLYAFGLIFVCICGGIWWDCCCENIISCLAASSNCELGAVELFIKSVLLNWPKSLAYGLEFTILRFGLTCGAFGLLPIGERTFANGIPIVFLCWCCSAICLSVCAGDNSHCAILYEIEASGWWARFFRRIKWRKKNWTKNN